MLERNTKFWALRQVLTSRGSELLKKMFRDNCAANFFFRKKLLPFFLPDVPRECGSDPPQVLCFFCSSFIHFYSAGGTKVINPNKCLIVLGQNVNSFTCIKHLKLKLIQGLFCKSSFERQPKF